MRFTLALILIIMPSTIFAWTKFTCTNESLQTLSGQMSTSGKLTLYTQETATFAKGLTCEVMPHELPLLRCSRGSEITFYSHINKITGYSSQYSSFAEREVLKFVFIFNSPSSDNSSGNHMREFEFVLNQCVVE